MTRLKTIIVENDPKSLSLLLDLISDYCPELDVISCAKDIHDATKQILNQKPDLVFLDIELDDGSGFDLLFQIPEKNFKTIIISGHSQYAIDAFKFEITHYLLKPVGVRDLRIAVERVLQYDKNIENQQEHRDKAEYSGISKKKLQVPTNEGIKIFNLSEIEYLQADGSYTIFYFINKKSITVSKNLKSFESILSEDNFYRIGRKHIINLDCVKVYNKQSGGKITMENGCAIIVPRRKKDEFLNYMNAYLK